MRPAQALPPFTGDPGHDGGFAVRLPRARSAAGAARHVVKKHFNDLLADETLDDALLVVSELVTNALLHGAGDIELRVAFDGQRVKGEVTDEGMRFTQPLREHDLAQIGGHGLYLVGCIADSWGRGEGSNHVWFEILAPRRC
jgi:anti-sigma regulatory factor (Ser/Thr protein kinase)